MSDPFLGEIRIMPYGGGGTYVPRGWAQCNGAILSIQSNSALFALLGVQYGGNGTTTFALPNLNGRAIVGAGQGPGLSSYPQGAAVGTEAVTLTSTQIPPHIHDAGTPAVAVGGAAATGSPAGAYLGSIGGGDSYGGGSTGTMAANLINGPTTAVGGGQAHDNRQPYLALNYYIATQGIFPQRQ